jgi:hypothetical protein
MKELKKSFSKALLKCATVLLTLFNAGVIVAQDFTTGIDEATGILTKTFDSVSNLVLAIGAIVGLIGGIRCYAKWNSGDQDVQKAIMGWGFAVLFLLVAAMTIRLFFGI